MTLQELLDKKGISRYQLSKISGVPKTTINDLCSGKSKIEKCLVKTIYLISKALECTMEDLVLLDNEDSNYDSKTGLPKNKEYLEKGLPDFLVKSIEQMKLAWLDLDNGRENIHWDLDWCELSSDINVCEVENIISSEQAWYLREKYLRMVREEI